MALFESRRVRALEEENESIFKLLLDQSKDFSEFRMKVYELFSYEGEFEKTIVEKLELTDLQKSKLELLFSIEKCRLCGIDEDSIIKYETVEKHVNKTEPTEES